MGYLDGFIDGIRPVVDVEVDVGQEEGPVRDLFGGSGLGNGYKVSGEVNNPRIRSSVVDWLVARTLAAWAYVRRSAVFSLDFVSDLVRAASKAGQALDIAEWEP